MWSVDGNYAQVDLAPIKLREPVAAASVGMGREAKSRIVRQGDRELADTEYRGDPAGDDHAGNDSEQATRPTSSVGCAHRHGTRVTAANECVSWSGYVLVCD